jgi:hypothetical protein
MLRQPEVVLERLEALNRCVLEFLRRNTAQNPNPTPNQASWSVNPDCWLRPAGFDRLASTSSASRGPVVRQP